MVNKKGDMTIGMIVAIVLAVTVLVFLVFGFSTGWGNFMNKVTSLGGGKMNVDEVIGSCNLACEQNNKYAFCSQNRNVLADDGYKGEYSCYELALNTSYNFTSSGKVNKTIAILELGFNNCPSLLC